MPAGGEEQIGVGGRVREREGGGGGEKGGGEGEIRMDRGERDSAEPISTGYFTNYYSDETWVLVCGPLDEIVQHADNLGTEYKICTGKNVNKEANTGVLEKNGKQSSGMIILPCHVGLVSVLEAFI